MAYPSSSRHRAALLAGAVTVLGLLTACGNGPGSMSAPQEAPVTAAPATAAATTGAADTPSAGSGTGRGGDTSAPGRPATRPASSPATSAASRTSAAAHSTRCHTFELRAAVGRNDPGAGQENFPLVLTNTSGRTCTVYGYPGGAFVDPSGRQLGPDPKRNPGSPTKVTLKPGGSAWSGLTFANPEVSGARTATPASLIVTPPDERDHLTVRWTAGKVPVGGSFSSVFLTVFHPGTGP
jgi:hypothetical protein